MNKMIDRFPLCLFSAILLISLLFSGMSFSGNKPTASAQRETVDAITDQTPTLVWNTFMGSSFHESADSIAIDESGNVYVAGSSKATWGSPVNAHTGDGEMDAFVAKLDSNGILQWNTFLGGSDLDYGHGIALDGDGNVYVAGRSDNTWGNPVSDHAGEEDGFVAKLNSNGALQWNTFLGSWLSDMARDIAVDGDGNVYVTGYSSGSWGNPINPFAGLMEVFAAKLNSNGVRQWNTFMGGLNMHDEGKGIAVDGSGNVYVTGWSEISWGDPVNGHSGDDDAFAAKLNGNGVRQWNTFMGSSLSDRGWDITLDSSGNVYVTGESRADWGSPINAYTGGGDAFVAKLNSNGAQQWNTFMGSSVLDRGYAIVVDGGGYIYVTGESRANWGDPLNAYAGGDYDPFVAELNGSGIRQWNTFMGSTGDSEDGKTIALDGSGYLYVGGTAADTWGNPVYPYTGSRDAFVAKMNVVKELKLFLPLVLR